MTIEITSKEQFLEEIAAGPVVVDFWAAWCGPCTKFTPEFHKAEELVSDVKFLTVDVDKHPWAMGDYGVRTIPNVQLFKDNTVRDISPASAATLAQSITE